jgi:hypothetical protein
MVGTYQPAFAPPPLEVHLAASQTAASKPQQIPDKLGAFVEWLIPLESSEASEAAAAQQIREDLNFPAFLASPADLVPRSIALVHNSVPIMLNLQGLSNVMTLQEATICLQWLIHHDAFDPPIMALVERLKSQMTQGA